MKKIFILGGFLFFASVCYTQMLDDFSDGDLTNSPQWVPDLSNNWVVVNNQLRSNSSVASSSFYISTPSIKATSARWEFWVNLQFNTSSANYVDVYLISEQSNLNSLTNNGYFVRIGGTPDEVSLYKMTNGTTSQLINGTDGVTNTSNNTLRIRVIRDAANNWTLERDATGGINYTLEGTVMDNAFITSQYFGIRIVQSTASFFNRHFFDDLYAGEIDFDGIPPSLEGITVLTANQISVQFNEPLISPSAENPLHYTASDGLLTPTSAVLSPDQKTVNLTWGKNFTNGLEHTLTVSEVEDLAGNKISTTTQPFLYFQALPVNSKDVILSEIFADPTPPVSLPEVEYVELYNRSPNPIDLGGWKFSDGGTTAILPGKIILPGQYWIIVPAASASVFTPFANTLGVFNFPALNNTGDVLTLRSSDNQLIDSVNYTLTWYRDEEKESGGWSLELIDLNNPCGESDNWTASEAPAGGTPGKQNSVNANKPDLTGPKLLSVSVVNTESLLVVFDEKIEKPIAPDMFSIEPAIPITLVGFASINLREVTLQLSQPLSTGIIYTLSVHDLSDCSGNFIQDGFSQLQFAVPEEAEAGDLLMNELLFNPRPGGVDFVEVYNTSQKYLNLKNWTVGNMADGVITNTRTITTNDYLVAPGSFVVLTSDGAALKNQYPLAVDATFLITNLPGLNDEAGSFALVSETGTLLDAFSYVEEMHTPMLKDPEGVSLERISLAVPTQNISNWKSASSASGYATPGFINSNAQGQSELDANSVLVEPEIFSPSRMGQDFAKIQYKFDEAGWTANIKIVDHQGRVIKEVANNETLATDGFFRWDGDRDDATKARLGYYFVWFEVFRLDGSVKTFRKRVVIGQ